VSSAAAAAEPAPPRILVVDDAIENLSLVTRILEREGMEVVGAPSADVALRIVDKVELDLAILDILMPGIDGLKLCHLIADRGEHRLPVIFISGREDSDTIVKAFAVGGVDYITKPIEEREVVARVSNHLKIARLQRELEQRNRELEEQIARRVRAEADLRNADERLALLGEREAARWVSGFVGSGAAARQICEEVARLNGFTRTNVLVTGESGCGKELIARAIHYGGARRDRAFLAVNCSAIPAELAESTFFGHVRGAFTGAATDRKGCFELADQGTLFLDEIAELPLGLQAKLLRTLEDGRFVPVGSSQERRAEVRIVSATHADLEARVESGAFRQDLYFRLAQYSLRVPALRERTEDIPLLARHFLRGFSAEMNRPCPEFAPEAIESLLAYGFPGNVRELKNIVERGLILSGGGRIESKHLQLTRRGQAITPSSVLESLNLDEVKAQLVERALAASHGNVSGAAKLLGVHRSWFYRRKSS
jgi:DNA-binding NtrC family response regulator